MVTCLPQLILRALVKCKDTGQTDRQTDGQSSYYSIDYMKLIHKTSRLSCIDVLSQNLILCCELIVKAPFVVSIHLIGNDCSRNK